MKFELRPDVASALGPEKTQAVNAAMQVLTDARLEAPAVSAKLTLQRELFCLAHAREEGMDP